jgi:plasmid stability protein
VATITVRNLDDAVYERLKREAKANHRSLEAEARVRLGGSVAPEVKPYRNWAEELRRLAIDPGPDYEGSVALIRAIRDEE